MGATERLVHPNYGEKKEEKWFLKKEKEKEKRDKGKGKGERNYFFTYYNTIYNINN